MGTEAQLGDKVTDRITGFEGIVTGEFITPFNVRRANVQPTGVTKDGALKEGYWFDVTTLTVIKEKVVSAEPLVKHEFNFLDKVKDKVTGFEGTITGIINHLNGCVKVATVPLTLKDGLPQDNVDFSVQRLTLVKPAVPVPPVRTGGPMDRSFKPDTPRMGGRL